MKKIEEAIPKSTNERVRRKLRIGLKQGMSPMDPFGRVVPKKSADNDPRRNKPTEIRKKVLKKKWHARHRLTDMVNEFEKYTNENKIENHTRALWMFCEDHPIGEDIIGNKDVEVKVRKRLCDRGWKISTESSFFGDADVNDYLDVVLND